MLTAPRKRDDAPGRHVTDSRRSPALHAASHVMLATQCSARPYAAARSHSVRARLSPALPGAAPPRSLVTARGARCSRKRAGAAQLTPHSGAMRADTRACALCSRRASVASSQPRRVAASPPAAYPSSAASPSWARCWARRWPPWFGRLAPPSSSQASARLRTPMLCCPSWRSALSGAHSVLTSVGAALAAVRLLWRACLPRAKACLATGRSCLPSAEPSASSSRGRCDAL